MQYPGDASVSASRLSLLVDLATLLAREVELNQLLSTACERMAEALGAERATLWLLDAEQGDLVTRVAVLPEVPVLRQPLDRGIAGHVARTGEIARIDDVSRDPRFDPSADRRTGYRTRSMLVAPVREVPSGPVVGVVQLLNRTTGVFSDDDVGFLTALVVQLGHALSLTTLRSDPALGTGAVLRGPFNHIVGRSSAMREVYERIAAAAETDASVLFRGETGTGKTLLARAVHVNSRRQTGPFVTVDCTTLPAELAESELFGHERGAFTGADRRVRGRVELADGGTLFLDEVGDLTPSNQAKFLRFLQERTFERIGGRETLESDVRVLTATHQDLETMVLERRFREDLYYRLRVVEIMVPPLRARGGDEIEQLTRHFADHFAKRYDRPSLALDASTIEALVAYDWPGNVRELEHWVESSVALSRDGQVREPPRPGPRRNVARSNDDGPGIHLPLGLSMDEVEQRYIVATVDQCEGNQTEAAKRLGIGRNTLGRALKARKTPRGRPG